MTGEKREGVTVLIPTYQRCGLLPRAVASVLQETRIPLRVHIFDNGSTDGTREYAEATVKADPRVQYTRREVTIGPVENYALAIASVETEYFVPLADDDWLLPDFLFDAYQILQGDAALGAAIFLAEARYEDGAFSQTYPIALDKIGFGRMEPAQHLADWMAHGHYHWSTVLWRTSGLDGFQQPCLGIGLPSDVDFQGQIFSRFPVYLKNQLGGVFLLHDRQFGRGYDMSHLPSWVTFIKRLDATVAAQGLFNIERYNQLRLAMLARYRPLWNIESAAPLSSQQLLTFAEAAGFHLGDWDLSYQLLGRVEQGEPNGPAPAAEFVALPDQGCGVERRSALGRFQDRTRAVIGWWRDLHGEAQNREAAVEALRGEIARLGQALAEADQEQDRLRQEKAALAQTVERLEDERAAAHDVVENFRRHIAHIERQLADVQASTSWRLTAPLRALLRLVKRGG